MISKRVLHENAVEHADAVDAIQTWYAVASAAAWNSFMDIGADFPSADMVGPPAIFNIRAGNYRLIVRMVFEAQRIYIKEFLTHAEYDKEKWKKWL